MALILSLETSGTVCSVAVTESAKSIFYTEFKVQHSHAEVVNVLVDQALTASGVLPSDLSAIAVSIGPGSYTGLRIGLSCAKGFAFAWNIPLIAIDTLKAMSLQVQDLGLPNPYLVPMLDARRMEVFTATFSPFLEYLVSANAFIFDDNIPVQWFQSHEGAIFFGDGMPKAKDFLSKVPHAVFLEGIYPQADAIGRLAEQKFNSSEFSDVAYQEPFYLKPFYTTASKLN